MLIDVAIHGNRNVIKRESENILKYKDLLIEVQCMWNMKEKVIPEANWNHLKITQTIPGAT
jgi:hypothetical protein